MTASEDLNIGQNKCIAGWDFINKDTKVHIVANHRKYKDSIEAKIEVDEEPSNTKFRTSTIDISTILLSRIIHCTQLYFL